MDLFYSLLQLGRESETNYRERPRSTFAKPFNTIREVVRMVACSFCHEKQLRSVLNSYVKMSRALGLMVFLSRVRARHALFWKLKISVVCILGQVAVLYVPAWIFFRSIVRLEEENKLQLIAHARQVVPGKRCHYRFLFLIALKNYETTRLSNSKM